MGNNDITTDIQIGQDVWQRCFIYLCLPKDMSLINDFNLFA